MLKVFTAIQAVSIAGSVSGLSTLPKICQFPRAEAPLNLRIPPN
jgi:hypothetical protein